MNDSYFQKYPDQAFQTLINRLNGKNLEELLLFSSFISIFDFFDTIDFSYNIFAPVINVELINLLSQAICRSKSQMYKDGAINKQDLDFFYCQWLNTIGFREKKVECQIDKQRAAIQQLLAMMNIQLRFQNHRINQRHTRCYILFCDIPNRYKEQLEKELQGAYISIRDEFQNKYGISVDLYFMFGMFFFFMFRNYFRKIYPQELSLQKRAEIISIDPEPTKSGNKYLFDKIEGLFRIYSLCRPTLKSIIIHSNIFANTSLDYQFKKYLQMMSTNIHTLRSMTHKGSKFNKGLILDQLNPLERYPLVEFKSNKYIIPNIRYLSFSISDSFHYILQDCFPENQYNMTLGKIQEIYIKELIESSFKPCFMLEELIYAKGKDEIRGPDLALFSDQLCIIESKSKRPSAQLRSDPGSISFHSEMKNIQDAFIRGINKVNDILSEIDIYSKYHQEIETAKKKQPIVIVIIGEGFEIPMEILIHHIKYSNFANLPSYPFKFALLNLSLLEEFVALSHKREIPIMQIFDTISIISSLANDDYPGMEYYIERYYEKMNKVNFPYFEEKIQQLQKDIALTIKLIEDSHKVYNP
ncbi:MAG: hypothetical protein ABFD00_01970 [Chloroherpetonaceae bacterium]|nr:hypothetical protein [bacterium]